GAIGTGDRRLQALGVAENGREDGDAAMLVKPGAKAGGQGADVVGVLVGVCLCARDECDRCGCGDELSVSHGVCFLPFGDYQLPGSSFPHETLDTHSWE